MLQRTTSLQNCCDGTVKTASRVANVDAYLSYIREIVLRRNPHRLYRNKGSHILSGSDIRKSTGGEYLF